MRSFNVNVSIMVLAGFLSIVPCAMSQIPYCALRVRVEDTSGSSAKETVRVVKADGEQIASHESIEGIAEFCDIDVGFERFSVIVGRDSCGLAVVKNLRINYPRTLVLRVVANECHGQEIPLGACLLLLAAHSIDGRPIHDARASVEVDHKLGPARTTDAYGRLFFTLPLDSYLNLTLSHAGYVPESVEIQCVRGGPRLIQRPVILKRE